MTMLLAVSIPICISGGIGGYYFIKNKMKKKLESNAMLSVNEIVDRKPYVRIV